MSTLASCAERSYLGLACWIETIVAITGIVDKIPQISLVKFWQADFEAEPKRLTEIYAPFSDFFSAMYNDFSSSIHAIMYAFGFEKEPDTISKGVEYAKSAGGYIVDKSKEIASTQMVQGAVNKVKEGVNYVNDTATNMLNNISGSNTNNNGIENNNQQNNLDFLNNNNNQSVYQQLSHDQM